MQKETRPFIPWELVDDFMTAVFVKLGLPEEDARLCSDVLMQSDKWGMLWKVLFLWQAQQYNGFVMRCGSLTLQRILSIWQKK